MFSKLASSKLAPSMVKRNLARTRPARFPLATVLGSIGVLACGQIYEDPTPGSGGTSGGTGGKTGVTLTGGAGGGSSGSGGSGGAGRGGTAGTTGITLVTGGSSSGGRTSAGGAAGQGAAPSGGSAGKGGAGGAGGTTVAGGSIGWAGAGGDWGDVGDYVALRESSWNVRLAMNVAPVSTYPVSCPKAEFTLHVKPVGDTLEVISGRNGSVMTGQLLRTPRLETTYGLGDQLGFPTRGECTFSTIGIKEIALWGWDENADGQADSIAGEGKAQAMFIMGDVGITVQMTFRLTGNPDTAPPTILPPSELHPLDGVMLTASEPLSLKSGAGLNSETGAARVPLTANVTDDAAIGSFSSARILDFGSRWRVTANGSDLAGLPFDQALTPSAVVLSDPGVFAQDGFEG
ncbi:MAG TPA: hypothetical protein VFQ61_12140, partial [Polyangiaceae bacterium]|nr:hypothetical protein [Polyangiaceae bacterium]